MRYGGLVKPHSLAKRVTEILRRLHRAIPNAKIALTHRNPFELTVATILSAQCTDERVNRVTPALFARFPTPAALSQASSAEVENLVRSTGFFRNKARSIIGLAQALVRDHGGEVPRTMEELVRLPGVARKTANVVLGTAFGIASGIVVDTHVTRLVQLLGLSHDHDPVKIEKTLLELVPEGERIAFSHLLILHGRAVCIARRPRCDACTLADLCPSAFGATAGKRRQSSSRSKRSKTRGQ
jgi:endonuclease-3